MNYRTAPVEIREKIAFNNDELREYLEKFLKSSEAREGLILSTCNRVEIYMIPSAADTNEQASEKIREFLYANRPIDRAMLDQFLYDRYGLEALAHLLKVVSSLDSMILGEPQILGQAKESFRIAHSAGTTGSFLNRCFMKAFKVAKEVRTKTGISRGGISVGHVAAELARNIFSSLKNRRILMIGSGKMGELTSRHLFSLGASSVSVINRSREKADEVALKYGWESHPFDAVEILLKEADIVISTIFADGFILMKETMLKIMPKRKYRPLFFVDIAVPRSVDPGINDVGNCYVYDIDDFQKIIRKHVEERQMETLAAEEIIYREVKGFEEWMKQVEVFPAIADLQKKFTEIQNREVEKALKMIPSLDDDEKNIVNQMAQSLINKIIHDPITVLKEEKNSAYCIRLIESMRKLFDLERPADKNINEEIENEEIKREKSEV
jgi:glutamyl-tRNA reductase